MKKCIVWCELNQLLLSGFNETFDIFSKKYSNTEFYENPSGESQGIPCGRKDRQIYTYTDMTKLVVAFRNFTKTPKTETDFNQSFADQAHCGFLICSHLPNKINTLGVYVCSNDVRSEQGQVIREDSNLTP
jgi:hypothetical protein